MKRFREILGGRTVTVFTDHKPLVSAFAKSESVNPRQHRQLSFLSEFVDAVEYIPGETNVVADALSRPNSDPVSEVSAITSHVFELSETANEQHTLTAEDLTHFQVETFQLAEGPILCDTSTPYPRPIVPEEFRKTVFDNLHSLAHPGAKRTLAIVKERFVWPNMRRDLHNWCSECLFCQQAKINRHSRGPVQQMPLFPNRFADIHVDLVGPLPAMHCRESYLVTMMDRATGWVEADPIEKMTAEEVARSILRTWICRFGIPSNLTTDRGSQFESDLFASLSRLLGFIRLRTTSYHPPSNGKIERFHRTLKSSLKGHADWKERLPIALFGYRICPQHGGESPSPAELVYGIKLHMPRSFIADKEEKFDNQFVRNLQKRINEIQFLELNPRYHPITDVHLPTLRGFVWLRVDRVRRPLEAPYTGPYRLIRSDSKTATIIVNDKQQVVSVNRLKPARVRAEEEDTDRPSKPAHKNQPSAHDISEYRVQPDPENPLPHAQDPHFDQPSAQDPHSAQPPAQIPDAAHSHPRDQESAQSNAHNEDTAQSYAHNENPNQFAELDATLPYADEKFDPDLTLPYADFDANETVPYGNFDPDVTLPYPGDTAPVLPDCSVPVKRKKHVTFADHPTVFGLARSHPTFPTSRRGAV